MTRITAAVNYRDDISVSKPWGTQSIAVELELRLGDEIIDRQLVNEAATIASSPRHLLALYLENIWNL